MFNKYISALSKRHTNLNSLIKIIGPLDYALPLWHSVNDAVLYAVIGQMLSSYAACSIIKKLLSVFGNSENIVKWAKKTSEQIGPIYGVSQRKRKALAEWYNYLTNNNISGKKWQSIPINQYRSEITSIWGFGRWSADMTAIFHLGRTDVWPETDAGIKKACRILFKMDEYSNIQKYVKGYESIAAIYLWKMLDNNISYNLSN